MNPNRTAWMGVILLAAVWVSASRGSAKEAAGLQDLEAALAKLPVITGEVSSPVEEDWLVRNIGRRAGVYRNNDSPGVVLTNGLIARTIRLSPNAATVAFDNWMTGASHLRGVKPMAMVEFDGRKYAVGGLLGQEEYGYLRPEWVENMTADPEAFRVAGLETGKTNERFPWKRTRYAPDLPWPPPGVSLILRFEPPPGPLEGLRLSVHYEMYDGIPLMAKWLTIDNGMERPVRLDTFTSEILAMVEYESSVGEPPQWEFPNIHVESDYAFHGMTPKSANETTHWVPDPQYASQVNYVRKMPVLLESRPPIGPDVTIEPGARFESFRTYELMFDSTERERKGLALRRMYRTLAPWALENPILMHVRRAEPDAVRLAVDQCAEMGFEMIIMTFGSGFNAENEDPAYIEKIRELADYAHGKGIELGGYSLLASRRISDEHDAIHPETGKPGGAIFGNSPCLCSAWGEEYFKKIENLFEKAGLDVLEHDGSYPGDVCASTRHPGHEGLADSQWKQWKRITDFYKWCRGRGIYLNVPDWYFLSGSNKNGMGYREVNWSLPRARQIILGRQNIFDGTWYKCPSMGWMFVPLVQYHGGGAAATLEPLCEHLDAYGAHLAQNFGSGVQACYRGPRLYDTDETRALVKKWVDFYKRYRGILDSDIIHVRRADGRDIDCMLHVNPRLAHRGLAMAYNPLDRAVEKAITLPLYYTGLEDMALIREGEGEPLLYTLDRKYDVTLPVRVPAQGVTWFVIEPPKGKGAASVYLEPALKAAQWLRSKGGFDTGDGKAWYAEPGKPATNSTNLYSGSAGVILFFLEAYHATGDKRYLEEAKQSADYLLVHLREMDGKRRDGGLYTGIAGIGFALSEVYKSTGEAAYQEGAHRCVRWLFEWAEAEGAGVAWSPVTDIISGSAGIGLFLLYAAEEMYYYSARRLAVQAGERLLELGIPEKGGLKWRMDPDYARLMPNFSHGTAGIGYFLATLHRKLGGEQFLEGALAAGRYLREITNDQGLVFHHQPGGEDLFYLGWCHGPAGTARLYYRLWEATGDHQWLEVLHRSAKGVMDSGIPERLTPGFWNTVGQCCGSAGVAEFFLDLFRVTGRQEYLDFSRRLTADLLARGTEEDGGMKWLQSEHRVRPELRAAQTGYMQGAAGIGMWLLHLDAFEQGGEKAITLPDSPF